jgi:hypothetical protein
VLGLKEYPGGWGMGQVPTRKVKRLESLNETQLSNRLHDAKEWADNLEPGGRYERHEYINNKQRVDYDLTFVSRINGKTTMWMFKDQLGTNMCFTLHQLADLLDGRR